MGFAQRSAAPLSESRSSLLPHCRSIHPGVRAAAHRCSDGLMPNPPLTTIADNHRALFLSGDSSDTCPVNLSTLSRQSRAHHRSRDRVSPRGLLVGASGKLPLTRRNFSSLRRRSGSVHCWPPRHRPPRAYPVAAAEPSERRQCGARSADAQWRHPRDVGGVELLQSGGRRVRPSPRIRSAPGGRVTVPGGAVVVRLVRSQHVPALRSLPRAVHQAGQWTSNVSISDNVLSFPDPFQAGRRCSATASTGTRRRRRATSASCATQSPTAGAGGSGGPSWSRAATSTSPATNAPPPPSLTPFPRTTRAAQPRPLHTSPSRLLSP